METPLANFFSRVEINLPVKSYNFKLTTLISGTQISISVVLFQGFGLFCFTEKTICDSDLKLSLTSCSWSVEFNNANAGVKRELMTIWSAIVETFFFLNTNSNNLFLEF